jgi:formylglycine-generating enzyme required for sulfatase activity
VPPRQPNAPTGPPLDQTAAAPSQGDLGAGTARKRGGRRWGALAGLLGGFGLLVLVALGLGGLAALSLRTSGTDSPRAPVPRPAAVADKAPRAGGARPPPLDCTGAEGVSAAAVKKAQEAWAKDLGRPVEEGDEIAPGVRITFVLVPPGRFLMGSLAFEMNRSDDEAPHEVTLTEPFDLGKTEVTQAQYQALTGNNPSRSRGADLPVETVSWEEAHDYAAWLTKKRGNHSVYRLPTEAEWEYACRGGRPSSQPFGIADGRALSSREANFDGNQPYGGADKGAYLNGTSRVGSYPANALGLFDMHGNVWEWCADWLGPYPRGAVTNPTGASEGSARVLRGGGWDISGRDCRAASRGRAGPEVRGPPWGSAWPAVSRPAASEGRADAAGPRLTRPLPIPLWGPGKAPAGPDGPQPNFGGQINLNAAQPRPWWAPRLVSPKEQIPDRLGRSRGYSKSASTELL